MGGLGTLLVARDNPELVDGIVLLAPFLGDEAVIRSVVDAGGLRAWEPPPIEEPVDQEHYSEALWAWLKGYADHPDERPPLFLGFGTEDRLAPAARTLAAVLPADRVLTASGGHSWSTWSVLWRRLMAHPPWNR